MKEEVAKRLFLGNPKGKSGNGFPWPFWRMKPDVHFAIDYVLME
jgi:hypothetical protein